VMKELHPIDNNGDCVLSLKENHGTLYNDAELFFDHMEDMKRDGYTFQEYTTVDAGHGRIETRKYTITGDIGWLNGKEDWAGLKCLGMAERIREIKGERSYEKSCYITSIESDAEKFGDSVRSRRGIENSVHWVLDIAFREDESRIRKGFSAENFSVLRHIALNLLRNNESFRGSIKTKRLNAAHGHRLFGEHCVQIKKFPTIGIEALQLLHALALVLDI
jgi:predicted transposase YbfD/YdcC